MTAEELNDLNHCLSALRGGGLIIYPTDTVWGIGCDATNSEAVRKVFALKQRPDNKALITLVDSLSSLERTIADIPEVAYQLIETADKPITIVYDKGINVASELLGADGTLGVRVTKEAFSAELCRRFKRPIVSTSVNISGEAAPKRFNDIKPELLESVDYVCEAERTKPWATKPSTVIRLGEGGLFKILRS